ncbi:unnamed protein product [Camellia sinensis]
MWLEIVCGLVIYILCRCFFYDDDTLDVETTDSNALFAVATRLEKLYGGKVYVGLRIPDADTGSPQNIDMVLVTKGEAVVISVQNLSGFVSIDTTDGSWVSTGGKNNKTERHPDPVAEVKRQVAILESYLEQRGAALPAEYMSYKVVCPNPNFRNRKILAEEIFKLKLRFGMGRGHEGDQWNLPFNEKYNCIHSDYFPSEVVTYEQWIQLKPELKGMFSNWIKGAFRGGKKEIQESIHQKLNFILSTAPTWDSRMVKFATAYYATRLYYLPDPVWLELKGNKYILGEFLEFKGKHEDTQSLRNIRRSKVSRLTIQKTSMFGLAHSKLQVLYSPRDYRNDGASASEWKEVTVRSSTEVLFQPQNSTKSSAMQKRFQRLSRNVSEAIASLKNSLNLDSARDSPPPPQSRIESCRKVVWGSVVRNLTQLYPGSQLPEKLVSNIRKHYDSLPLSCAQAGFDMKDVFMHIKLIEQASEDDQPAILIQEVSDDEVQGSVFKLTFACNSAISWAAMSGALDSASICCKKIQIFEKTSVPLNIAGVALMSFPVLNSHLRLRFEIVDGLILDSPWALRLRVCRQKMHKKSNKRFFLLQPQGGSKRIRTPRVGSLKSDATTSAHFSRIGKVKVPRLGRSSRAPRSCSTHSRELRLGPIAGKRKRELRIEDCFNEPSLSRPPRRRAI